MTKQQEFRKQTEEAKFEAFSLMCKKVAELEKENKELDIKRKAERQIFQGIVEKKNDQLTKATELLKEAQGYIENINDVLYDEIEQFLKEIEK